VDKTYVVNPQCRINMTQLSKIKSSKEEISQWKESLGNSVHFCILIFSNLVRLRKSFVPEVTISFLISFLMVRLFSSNI